MIAPRNTASAGRWQKQMADRLKEAGYNLKDCQLTRNDFKRLSELLETEDSDEMIKLYLDRCRQSSVRPASSGGFNYVLMVNGAAEVMSRTKMGIGRARDDWRQFGCLQPSRGSCCMD